MPASPDRTAPAIDGPLSFVEDVADSEAAGQVAQPWKIIIADDDDAVHSVSRLVLSDFSFEGRGMQFISAHSGEEARLLVAEHPDCAVLLLDVVMETEDAGLEVVRYIRETLRNYFLRIVLRTGQPGHAPERQVILNYDINDYKEKTELTAQRLVTTVVAALRAYRDIQTIEASRRGLEHIIHATRSLFEKQSLQQFSAGVLQQLTALLNLGADSMVLQCAGFTARRDEERSDDDFIILAGTGQYEQTDGRRLRDVVAQPIARKLMQAVKGGKSSIDASDFVGYFRTASHSENLVYLHTRRLLGEMDSRLLEVFSANVAIAFDNLYLADEVTSTQSELIHMLGEVVENRSSETGQHVLRVGESSCLMARLIGLPERDCELLRIAAPMHDVGKIGIPDAILCKPGKLTEQEFEVMKNHTTIGHNILKGARREALRAAAIVALEHHEWWDGSGYPRALKGNEIHVFGRIVAIADVFDALAHKRVYKDAWPIERVLDHIGGQAGTKFDPRLVHLLAENVERFVEIQREHPDRGAH